jgi:glyoxylase-like metal-dependent hydrolase (beta-lactamase superfamily II)
MIRSLSIGNVQLHLIRDASVTIAGNSALYPAKKHEWGKWLSSDEKGQIPVAVTALVIVDGEEISVVDTGFGEEEDPDRPESLYQGLQELGIRRSGIRRVIITHAHGDHCLGCTFERNGKRLAAFPKATYVLQEKEYQNAKKEPQLWHHVFEPLENSRVLRKIRGETALSRSITCLSTPGHTPGHQSVLIEAGGSSAIFLGDLAIFAVSMERTAWGPDWAWSREEDILSRKRIAQYAADNGSILIVGHDPDNTFIRLESASAGFRANPVRPG